MTKALQSPPGYAALLKDIKERVRTAQIRAALAVNRELILLYWSIGRDILVRQEAEGWGTKVIERQGPLRRVSRRRGVQSTKPKVHA